MLCTTMHLGKEMYWNDKYNQGEDVSFTSFSFSQFYHLHVTKTSNFLLCCVMFHIVCCFQHFFHKNAYDDISTMQVVVDILTAI